AQGAALGIGDEEFRALKGRHNVWRALCRPFRARRIAAPLPGALPRALLYQPFGLKTGTRSEGNGPGIMPRPFPLTALGSAPSLEYSRVTPLHSEGVGYSPAQAGSSRGRP